MIRWEPSSTCTGYLLDTLQWTKNGRTFLSVGYASSDGAVEHLTELFPNARYGYNRRNLCVTTIHYPPFVIRREDSQKKPVYEGAFIDLLAELSRVLNFTYTLIDPPDAKWGSVETFVNDTPIFNGMVGQLQRRECDVAAAPLAILPVRDRAVDFSYPVYHEYTTVVVKKPDPNAKKWKTLISPFKWQVLIAIVLVVPIVTVLLYVMEKYNPYYAVPRNAKARSTQGGLHHLHDSYWYMSGALLYQGGVHLPDSTAGRTFVSCWWLFCIIVGGIYCGNLIAFLTVSKDVLPFNSLKEMAKLKGTYKWGTLGGTNWEIIFTSSKNSIIQEIGDAMVEFNKSDDVIFHLNTEAHIQRVNQGNYAFIGDLTTVGLAMAENCDFRKIKEEFLPMKNAFAFQENSPHTAIFSDQIMKSQEAGLFEIWQRNWWPKESICVTGTKPEATPITLLDVQSAFYVCIIGCFLGNAVFIIEIVYHRFKHGSGRRAQDLKQEVEDN